MGSSCRRWQGGTLGLATKFLEEGEEHVKRGDPAQASEKLYKAAEESVKALSAVYVERAYEESVRRGRWTVGLLSEAVRELSKKLGMEVRRYWDAAWYPHVEGFHEARLGVEDVKIRLADVKRLLELAAEGAKAGR